jgi:hypothetical protein
MAESSWSGAKLCSTWDPADAFLYQSIVETMNLMSLNRRCRDVHWSLFLGPYLSLTTESYDGDSDGSKCKPKINPIGRPQTR